MTAEATAIVTSEVGAAASSIATADITPVYTYATASRA